MCLFPRPNQNATVYDQAVISQKKEEKRGGRKIQRLYFLIITFVAVAVTLGNFLSPRMVGKKSGLSDLW